MFLCVYNLLPSNSCIKNVKVIVVVQRNGVSILSDALALYEYIYCGRVHVTTT